MIKSCMDGGYAYDCISMFESMKDHCTPNIGTINAILKVYGHIDMFAKAKELFENIKKTDLGCSPDAHSYTLMLETSASAHQWEYFEYLYKEMVLCGFQMDQNKHAWVLVEASRAGKVIFFVILLCFIFIALLGSLEHKYSQLKKKKEKSSIFPISRND